MIDKISPITTPKPIPIMGTMMHIATYVASKNNMATLTPQGIDLIRSFILTHKVIDCSDQVFGVYIHADFADFHFALAYLHEGDVIQVWARLILNINKTFERCHTSCLELQAITHIGQLSGSPSWHGHTVNTVDLV